VHSVICPRWLSSRQTW